MSFATFELAYWQILKEEGQRIMKRNGKKLLVLGIVFMVAFAIWTVLIQIVDVQTLGQNGTEIGFATFNCWFHSTTENKSYPKRFGFLSPLTSISIPPAYKGDSSSKCN